MSLRAPLIASAAALLLLAGCGEEKVAVYRVPHEKDPDMAASGADSGAQAPQADQAQGGQMADAAVPTAAGTGLAWDAPAAWTVKPASAMRKASYGVAGAGGEADLSVTAFPGDVGGELANVNRWRGQIGLPALQEGELDSAVSRFEANGLKFTVVELEPSASGEGKAILGAMVPFQGSTWFFKLLGAGPVVKASRADFLAFVRTVRAPATQAPAAQMADTAVPTAGGADLAWQAPSRWTAGPASAMRKASYGVPGAGVSSELSVTAFPGDVGGELANVNRWRGQIGLPALQAGELDAAVSRFEANGLRFTVVELDPPGGGDAKGILGAIVPFQGSTWFFKLAGPGPSIAASKAEFLDFLRTVRAP